MALQERPHAPAPKKGSALKVILVLAAALVAIGAVLAGAIVFGLSRGQGGDDVGDLDALQAVQAQLRPLDACDLQYNTHASRHQYLNNMIAVQPCSGNSFLKPRVLIPVPANWPYKKLRFGGRRFSQHFRWTIEVDRASVPFQDLVAALESMAPTIVATYPGELARKLAEEANAKQKYEADLEERRRAGEKAKETYPSK
ncbi:MAG: hypothetical protein IPG50_08355 [Myxococcales bacterium]|nr:hypothetical protein [Myxococcales bacterium]